MLLKPTRGIRLNKSHPLARGLVGLWLFNEGSGNKVFDLSGNGNTGTFVNAVSWVPGKSGSTLNFNGVNTYVNLGSKLSLDNLFDNPATFTAWICMDSWGESEWGHIYHKRDVDDIGGGTRIYVCGPTPGDSYLKFVQFFSIGVAGAWVTPANSLSLYERYHIAIVYDGSSINNDPLIYINGINQAVNELTAPQGNPVNDASYDAWLGSRHDGLREFDGGIDLPMLWNRALSASEVALLYREPFCMFDRADNVARLSSLVAPQIVELAGTSMALSSLSAIAKASRKVGGTIASTSNVDGSLGIMPGGQIVELIGTVAGTSSLVSRRSIDGRRETRDVLQMHSLTE